jgi:ankyrin repeat protein
MLFSLDYGKEHGRTALHTAAENNDVPFIKEWIAKHKKLDQGLSYGGNIEARGTRGVTALMLAAQQGNYEATITWSHWYS